MLFLFFMPGVPAALCLPVCAGGGDWIWLVAVLGFAVETGLVGRGAFLGGVLFDFFFDERVIQRLLPITNVKLTMDADICRLMKENVPSQIVFFSRAGFTAPAVGMVGDTWIGKSRGVQRGDDLKRDQVHRPEVPQF